MNSRTWPAFPYVPYLQFRLLDVTSLTTEEIALTHRLPRCPRWGSVRTTNVWIVEWLFPDDKRTGRLLHEWMKQRRNGWSRYTSCASKAELLAAIREAANYSEEHEASPILHIEAHGNSLGLEGPNALGGTEFMEWRELTPELQALNVATECNLAVFVAACKGFAGIDALAEGPRAPAAVLIGPVDDVTDTNLFEGVKEFYRRWMDADAVLHEVADHASQQAGGDILFEPEPFAALAYETFVKHLIVSMRPSERRERMAQMRARLANEIELSDHEINHDQRLHLQSEIDESLWQTLWDEMFMIDLFPENRTRFGLDVREIVRLIAEFHGQAGSDDNQQLP